MGRRPVKFDRRQPYFFKRNVTARRIFTQKWIGRFARFGAGAGAVAAAGLANLFTKVPKLDTMPRMVGYKRRRPSSGGAVDDTQTGVQAQRIDYKYSTGGRKVGKRKRLMQALETHVVPLVERWSLCSTIQSSNSVVVPNGALQLKAAPIDSPITQFEWPVYLWDLSGVFNPQSTLGGSRYPHVCFQLVSGSAALADFSYRGRSGANDIDTLANTNSWVTERSGKNTALTTAGEKCVIDGFKLDLATYGASRLPSEVYVELWRFKDEQLCPANVTCPSPTGAPGGQTHNPESLRMNDFWRQKLGGMIGRMDHKNIANPESGKGVEIRRIAHFKYDPQLSTEQVQAGHQRNLHYFHRWNKTFKYDWWDNQAAGLPVLDVDNPDVFIQENIQSNCMPTPKQSSRWFLVIRGDIQQYADSFDQSRTLGDQMFPSFDIVLRRYRRVVKD